VLRALELARQNKLIGAPLDARVSMTAGDDLYPLLGRYLNELPGLLIVSQVDLEHGDDTQFVAKIERAQGQKCERCWKYTTDVGRSAEFPTLCAPCVEAVQEMLGE